MRKWENEKMREWENEKMWEWENVRMRKWENESLFGILGERNKLILQIVDG